MIIQQTRSFKNKVKKLHKNQKTELDIAIQNILINPLIGEEKTGDLAGVRIHKFYMYKQLTLIAYTYYNNIITLLTLGSHENFYRDLKTH